MKRLPIVLLMIAAGVFFTFRSLGTDVKSPPDKYEEIVKLVRQLLLQAHFSPQEINDDFSQKVFDKYIKELDPEKNMLLKKDIDQLASQYRNKIDEEIKGAPLVFFKEAGKLFQARMEESAATANEILKVPFDFTIDEKAVLDADSLDFPANKAELKERWRKKLKYLSLERYDDLLTERAKNKDKKDYVVKTDKELEKEAREKVQRIIDRTFERFRFKFSEEDKFNLFVRSITNTMDPHTDFFPPVDKRYFDEEMSGRFYGIGASLVYEEGNIKISSILTGSPAWKSGELQAGDVIQKVAEGDAEAVDLTGFVTSDAVKVIRGKKGTVVKLTVKRTDGSIKVVSLVRDEIVQDEAFVRSAVIKNENSKIGYIYLPDFYADFDNPGGNRSFTDVANEIKRLKEEKVEGIVMDLRNNGGGSLYDVVQMVGLFIEDGGAVVQVKERDTKQTNVLKVRDKGALYTGPLTVLVNEFSASASEIFAAAIQDYGRGIVLGSTSTYGKGTVQRNIGLDSERGFSMSNADLGTVKLTLQKFYRVNGGSTQLKGVASDIVLPDQLEYFKIREKDNTDALPWDVVVKAPIREWNAGFSLQTIRDLGNQRIENDSTFQKLKRNTEWLSKQNNKEYSLKLDKYKQEQKIVKEIVEENRNLLKLKKENEVVALPGDDNRWSEDKAKQDRFNQWLKNLRSDIYIDQAVKSIDDMVDQKNIAMGIKKVDEKQKKPF